MKLINLTGQKKSESDKQELIRWDSERERFYDDIVHVEAMQRLRPLNRLPTYANQCCS